MKMLKSDSLIYVKEKSSLRADRDTKNSRNIRDSDFSALNFSALWRLTDDSSLTE